MIRPGYENFWMYIRTSSSAFNVYATRSRLPRDSLYASTKMRKVALPSAIWRCCGRRHQAYSELLKPFGLDAGSRFWDGRLSVIVEDIDELEGWADCRQAYGKGLVMARTQIIGSRRVP